MDELRQSSRGARQPHGLRPGRCPSSPCCPMAARCPMTACRKGLHARAVKGFENFEQDLLRHLIPAIQARYSTATGREQRAGRPLDGRQADLQLRAPATSTPLPGSVPSPPRPTPAPPESWCPARPQPKPSSSCSTSPAATRTGLISFSQGVHRYLVQHQVPHLWNVDDHSHDGETWGSSLYRFAQLLFR